MQVQSQEEKLSTMLIECRLIVTGHITSSEFHKVMRHYKPDYLFLNGVSVETISASSEAYAIGELSICSFEGDLLSLCHSLALHYLRDLVIDGTAIEVLINYGAHLSIGLEGLTVSESVIGEDLAMAIATLSSLTGLTLFECKLGTNVIACLQSLNNLESLMLTGSASIDGTLISLALLRELPRLKVIDIAGVDIIEEELDDLRRECSLEVMR